VACPWARLASCTAERTRLAREGLWWTGNSAEDFDAGHVFGKVRYQATVVVWSTCTQIVTWFMYVCMYVSITFHTTHSISK